MSWDLPSFWLTGWADWHYVRDEAGVSSVRQAVRQKGAALAVERIEKLVSAASELAHNQLRHVGEGLFAVRSVSRLGVPGVEAIFADRGPGLADPAAALSGRSRGSGGLGIGLSAAYRLCDEMDFDVRLGEGTCIWARKFASSVERREVAVIGRGCEQVSGDHAAWTFAESELTLTVVDGVGHGVLGREAADVAVRAFRESRGDAAGILQQCQDALAAGPRGASQAVVLLHLADRTIGQAVHGDVTVRVGRTTVVMTTDGLSSRLQLEEVFSTPLLTAQHLLERFARTHDDALVLVFQMI